LLLLNEPVASLDPLAKREFLQGLMEVVAAHGVSVVLSTHQIADLERVCDYLIVLATGRAALTGEVDALLASHRRLSGPRRDPSTLPANQSVIEASHVSRGVIIRCRRFDPPSKPWCRCRGEPTVPAHAVVTP
jgi:ABC-2 type transport system ATP-binding protein